MIGDFGACKNLHFNTYPSDPAAAPDAEALAAPSVLARGQMHSSSRCGSCDPSGNWKSLIS